MNTLAILLALLLDQLLGEPRKLHPLVGFGHWAGLLERWLNRSQQPTRGLICGSIAWALAILPVLVPVSISYLLLAEYRWLLDAAFGYLCIARRSLREHVLTVYRALRSAGLQAARDAVGRIVSRETHALEAAGVRKAAIESALENGSDAIFAPLFWLAVGGAPAVVLYRLVNTLDAMWGYRSRRFLYFGRIAARTDDFLNWLPARLTALTFVALGRSACAMRSWREQAPRCASPNAGPVMASGAGALEVTVGGPAVYHGRVEARPLLGAGRAPEDEDLPRALALLDRALAAWCLVIAAIWLGVSILL